MDYDRCVHSLERMLAGERIREACKCIILSNLNSPQIVDIIVRDESFFVFELHEKTNRIEFFNVHREAPQGKGSVVLHELETVFAFLAQRLEKKVVVSFLHADQEDTIRWLIKNNYTEQKDCYVKEIH